MQRSPGFTPRDYQRLSRCSPPRERLQQLNVVSDMSLEPPDDTPTLKAALFIVTKGPLLCPTCVRKLLKGFHATARVPDCVVSRCCPCFLIVALSRPPPRVLRFGTRSHLQGALTSAGWLFLDRQTSETLMVTGLPSVVVLTFRRKISFPSKQHLCHVG